MYLFLHYWLLSVYTLMFGTLDIHPVYRECLTLHGIWFLEMCNHGLEDCFLLSRGENDELGGLYQMSLSSGLFSSNAQFHCVRCLIEVLLKIVMILSSHQWGFVRVDTAYNLFSG